MNDTPSIQQTTKGRDARLKALEEIDEEDLKKAVNLYKTKLRELNEARVVVANVEREVKELELKIDQGNI